MTSTRRIATAAATAAALLAGAPAASADAACAGADRPATAAELGAATRALTCLVNQERARQGLPALRADRKLAKAARRHAIDQARRHYFAHVAPDGGRLLDRVKAAGWLRGARSFAIGENIACGHGELSTPASALHKWLQSPAHRRNMLSGKFRGAGIGAGIGDLGAACGYGTVFVLNLGYKG